MPLSPGNIVGDRMKCWPSSGSGGMGEVLSRATIIA